MFFAVRLTNYEIYYNVVCMREDEGVARTEQAGAVSTGGLCLRLYPAWPPRVRQCHQCQCYFPFLWSRKSWWKLSETVIAQLYNSNS